jgi:hypothetical protein
MNQRNTYANPMQNDSKKLPPINQRNSEFYPGKQNQFDVEFNDSEDRGSAYPNKQGTKYTEDSPDVGGKSRLNSEFRHNTSNLNIDSIEGRPIQFLITDAKTGKYKLNVDEIVDYLALEGNVGFVTIAGKYKTGKSFLMNKLLNLPGNALPVDPSQDVCTKGVWMWSKPIYVEKDNLYLFFLDAEGSRDPNKTTTHDDKLYSLLSILSNFLIYNSMGSIDENTIFDLEWITRLTKYAQVSEDDTSEQVLSYYTPKLIWALRDFVIDLQDTKGNTISPTQYMESVMMDPAAFNKSTDANKKIRLAFSNLFKDRECITFPKPGNDVKKFPYANNNELKPEFTKQINALRDRILSRISPKQIKGVNLTMKMFITLVQQFTEYYNASAPVNISLGWQYVVESEANDAFEESRELYDIALQQFLGDESIRNVQELFNILKNIRDSTLERFDKFIAAIENNECVLDQRNRLKNYMDEYELRVLNQNNNRSHQFNLDLLEQLSAHLRESGNRKIYTIDKISNFNDDFQQFLEDYEQQASEGEKTTALIDYLKQLEPELIHLLIQTIEQKYLENETKKKNDIQRLKENEKSLTNQIKGLQDGQGGELDQISKLKEDKQELEHKTHKMDEELSKLSKEGAEKLDKRKAQLELEKKKDIAEKQKQIDLLAHKHKQITDEIEKRNKKACCEIF